MRSTSSRVGGLLNKAEVRHCVGADKERVNAMSLLDTACDHRLGFQFRHKLNFLQRLPGLPRLPTIVTWGGQNCTALCSKIALKLSPGLWPFPHVRHTLVVLPTQQICCAGEAPSMTHSGYLDTRCQKSKALSKALGIQRGDKGIKWKLLSQEKRCREIEG